MNKHESEAIRAAVLSSTQSWQQKPAISDKDIQQFKTVSAVVLGVLAAAGGVAVLTIAPNLMKALTVFQGAAQVNRRFSHVEKQRKIIKSLYYLKSSGQIEMQTLPGESGPIVRVLPKGMQHLSALSRKSAVPKLRTMPHTWWLIAADIPTKTHRASADVLRKKLKVLGFYSIQRSLWISPHEPKKLLEPLLNGLDLGKYVTLMEVCRLDKEDLQQVRQYFQI